MLERLAAAGVSDEQGRRLDVRDRVSPVVVGRVCDDEPLLRTEAALGATQPDRLVRGLAAAGILCGADDLLLAVSEDDRGSLLALERRVQGSRVRLQPISPRVPLDSRSLCCDLAQAAGRSAAAMSLDRALVLDAVVLADLAEAMEGRTSVRRAVTVAGHVRRPAVLQAPVGTPLAELVSACGGSPDPAWVPFHNGAMRGSPVAQHYPVELHTRGVLVLPQDHPLVVRRTTPLADEARRAASACVRCRLCTEACTSRLAGTSLEPDLVVQAAAAGWLDSSHEPSPWLNGALECINCAVCSACCPSGLRPDILVAAIAARLAARGVTSPAEVVWLPHVERPARRLTLGRAAERLGLRGFAEAEPRMTPVIPDRVVISLRGSRGRLRVPTVKEGERVSVGDLVALAPAVSDEPDGRASVTGRVVSVDPDEGVVIQPR